MVKITDKQNCCGCSSCVQKCPRQCVFLKQDEEGFSYPVVDEALCANCGICDRVCPILNVGEPHLPQKTYAAINNNDTIREESSSGGVFSIIAEEIINRGGVVFGARFDKEYNVYHDFVEKIEDISLFRCSKYVQSQIRNTYKDALRFLISGRLVLYSGTPCQIAGLQSFLGKQYDNLFTVDFICHGVPSPKVWQWYLGKKIKSEEKNRVFKLCKSQISSVNFRDKTDGWRNYKLAVGYKDQLKADKDSLLISESFLENSYMRLFLNDIILRPSCYSCSFKSGKSLSDFTIADFWGVKDFFPSIEDNKGVSLICINTNKSNSLCIFSRIQFYECNVLLAVNSNRSWHASAQKHEMHNLFYKKYTKCKNVDSFVDYILRPSYFIRILRKCFRVIGCKQIPI